MPERHSRPPAVALFPPETVCQIGARVHTHTHLHTLTHTGTTRAQHGHNTGTLALERDPIGRSDFRSCCYCGVFWIFNFHWLLMAMEAPCFFCFCSGCLSRGRTDSPTRFPLLSTGDAASLMVVILGNPGYSDNNRR